jgi:hypothetical protein
MSTAFAFDLFDEDPFAALVCPDCGRPAAIEDRWDWPSTDGLVEMVKVRCAAGCWFTLPRTDLESA